jgi:hypothetical protein
MSGAASVTPMTSVYAGQRCIGFIFKRGPQGFEAFDAEEHSLGIFSTQREAAHAVSQRVPR